MSPLLVCFVVPLQGCGILKHAHMMLQIMGGLSGHLWFVSSLNTAVAMKLFKSSAVAVHGSRVSAEHVPCSEIAHSQHTHEYPPTDQLVQTLNSKVLLCVAVG